MALPPASMAVARIIDVPWHRTNSEITIRLELREEDGSPVQVPGPAGSVPVRVEAAFEVRRPVGVAAGSAIPVPMAIPMQNLPLTPGRCFYWELSVAGETRDDWTLHFATRPPPQVIEPQGPADFPLPPAQ